MLVVVVMGRYFLKTSLVVHTFHHTSELSLNV